MRREGRSAPAPANVDVISRRQIPVILENCTAGWEAQRSWSFDYFLGLGGGEETWRTDFIDNQEILQLWGQKGANVPGVALTNWYVTTERISGQLVSQIIRNNGSVRIFEVLGRKRAREAGRVGDQTFRLKERLMSDYARPGPIPPGDYCDLVVVMDSLGCQISSVSRVSRQTTSGPSSARPTPGLGSTWTPTTPWPGTLSSPESSTGPCCPWRPGWILEQQIIIFPQKAHPSLSVAGQK